VTERDLSRPTLDEGSSGPATGGTPRPAVPVAARWERGAELGWGGMGRVVLTRDAWLGREVALKEPVAPVDADHVRREALLTAGLEHPGIVPVYDTGTSPDGRPWFAMQVVRGRSLAAILADNPSTEARYGLIRHLVAAAEAVAFAHARGVVHRDLKPGNIMIGPFGDTKVIDWGLAMEFRGPGASLAELSAGTLRAMSPEQARGEPQGPPSDVWSLGAILWELIAGSPAYPHSNPESLRAELSAGRLPRLSSVAPDVAPALVSLVHRAMDPDPARRYPDAGAFATELQRYIDGQLVTSHAYTGLELLARFMRAWRGTLITAFLAILAVVTALTVGFREAVSERDRAEQNLAQSLVANARYALRTDAVADAELLALQALERADLPEARGVLAALGSRFRPARTELAQLQCTPLDLHPDRVLCASGEELQVWRGSEILWRRIFPDFRHAVFFDYGAQVAVVHESTVETLDARSGAPTAPPKRRICGRPRPSLGARLAVFTSATCATQLGAEGFSPAPQSVCDVGGFSSFAVSADGAHGIALCRDGFLVAAPLDRLGLAPRVPLPPRIGVHDVSAAALHTDGVTAVLGTEDGTLWLLDLSRNSLALIERGQDRVARIIISPDGRHALARRESGPPQLIDLVLRASLGRVGGSTAALATFRADGQVLTAGGGLSVWDYRDVLPRVLQFPDSIQALALSPDGQLIGVAAASTAYVIEVATRREVARERLGEDIVRALAFSSDSRSLLVHSFATGGVQRVPLSSVATAPIPDPGERGIWRNLAEAPDKSLLTVSHQGVVARLRAGAPPEVLVSTRSLADASVSRDASRFALLTESGEVIVSSADGQERHCDGPRGGRAVAFGEGDDVLVARRDTVHVACGRAEATKIVMRAPGSELTSLVAGHGHVAAGARDGSLHVWRSENGALVSVTQLHAGRLEALLMAPDGSWVAAGGVDGRLAFVEFPNDDPVDAGEVASAVRRWGLEAASDDLVEELVDAP
jgi:WD40 repeat protein